MSGASAVRGPAIAARHPHDERPAPESTARPVDCSPGPPGPSRGGAVSFGHGDRTRGPDRSPAARSRSPTRARSTSRRPATPSSTSSATTWPSPTGALRGAGGRPMALKRFVDGAAGEPFFQKRAPDNRPDWIRTATLTFPSGRTADEIVVDDAAGLAWVVNLGCIDLNPHPVRADDLDHPDELRVDLDPVPGVAWDHDPRRRAGDARGARGGRARRLAQDVRARAGSTSTSGSSRAGRTRRSGGRRWRWPATSSGARPEIATSKWWKEERHGVFLDYNQNAKDRTVASAYSVRPLPDARVSTPLAWDEVADRRGRGVHDRHGAGALRRDRRPGRRHRRGGRVARGAPRAEPARTRPRAWATRRGRRTTRSRPASRRASSRRAGGGAPRSTSRAAARAAGRRRRSPRTRRAAVERGRPERRPADRVGRLAPDADGPAQDLDPGHRDLAGRVQGGGAGRARALEGAPPRGSPRLEPADVLVDGMRGRSTLWYRVRVNLIHVPEAERPPRSRSKPTTTRGPATSGRTGPGSSSARRRKRKSDPA